MKHDFSKPGFVILFAVLISVIVLLIGFGMYNIAVKESYLSSVAEEAQLSFVAADGGSECVLLALSSALTQGVPAPTVPISCNGGQYAFSPTGNPDSYDVEIPLPGNLCAKVTYSETGLSRTVYSQGYNRCTATGEAAAGNPRLVERVLELTYSVPAPEPE